VTRGATTIAGTVTAGATSVSGQQGGADAQVCTDAANLKSSLQALGTLTSSSTVGQAQQALAGVQQSFNALKQSAQQAHANAVNDIQNAYNNLSAEVNSISGGTLGQNASQVQGFVAVVLLADSNLAKPAGCSGF
jgi:hypothetical protein